MQAPTAGRKQWPPQTGQLNEMRHRDRASNLQTVKISCGSLGASSAGSQNGTYPVLGSVHASKTGEHRVGALRAGDQCRAFPPVLRRLARTPTRLRGENLFAFARRRNSVSGNMNCLVLLRNNQRGTSAWIRNNDRLQVKNFLNKFRCNYCTRIALSDNPALLH